MASSICYSKDIQFFGNSFHSRNDNTTVLLFAEYFLYLSDVHSVIAFFRIKKIDLLFEESFRIDVMVIDFLHISIRFACLKAVTPGEG